MALKWTLLLLLLYENTITTTMSILMPLSWLGGVMHPFFSSHIIPDSSLCSLPTISLVDPFFPSYFKLHNLTYLGVAVSTDDMSIPPQMALNYPIVDLHSSTHSIPRNISHHPIDQSTSPTHHPYHMTLHGTSLCLQQ